MYKQRNQTYVGNAVYEDSPTHSQNCIWLKNSEYAHRVGGPSFVDLLCFVLSCVCYVFVRVCFYVPCGHLLEKG